MNCLHEMVMAQARRSPDAVALEFEGRELTYQEMDRWANRLAWRLRKLGAGPESVVAVATQRSLELVVALLGVMKAGAAYLPLDMELPADRLRYMVAQAGARILVRAPGANPVPDVTDPLEVVLDELLEESDEPPVTGVDERNAAYAMFTSGSTGRPKGVVVDHRGICNRLRWGQQEYAMTPDERVMQKTPYSFDVSVWELFWPLIAGARLVIARPGGHRDSRYVVDTVKARGITTVHFIPTMLSLFVGERGLEDCHSLRRVMCSGEALPLELQERLLARLPHVELHNLYGPTEASVEVSAWQCRPGWPGPNVPIGRAVANTQLHILDADMRPVPIGTPGDLYIGGVQVARGYLGRPDLTAELFVPDPYGTPGDRLYRTGDVAQWLEPGVVDYLGRADEQVKLGGNRVELGEVQAVLREQPGVRTAVVLVSGDGMEQRLVAYVVGDELQIGELRERLAQRLPAYMVPSAFVQLDKLPLTPSGKLDRKALPEPDRPDMGAAYRAPRTELETTLAGLYAEVLGVARVGLDDDFFALGGHSLLGVRLISRVRARLGGDLSLRTLFETPTVAGLAGLLGTPTGGTTAITRRPDGEPPALSFGQERLLFLDRMEPDSPLYVLPVAWRLHGPLDRNALQRALRGLAARHESLRTTFGEIAGERVPRVSPDPGVPLRWIDHCGQAWSTELAVAELSQPFDLSRGPLLRAVVWQLAEREHVLLLAMHHIVADGWSTAILARELGELYAGRELPEPAIQYPDFARWQREQLRDARLADELGYWRQRLAGLPVLELPTDRPRPTVLGTAGATLRFELPCDAVRALRGRAREHGATLYMALLAAFEVLLGKWSGQDDFGVGTPAAGRTRPEVEGLVGFFVNTLVMRAELAGDPTFDELLGRVRDGALGAYEHQDVPFERVVEELRPERDLSRSPLFQASFAFSDGGRTTVGMPGVEDEELHLGWRTAKFDLTLFVDAAEDGTLTGLVEYATDLFDEATAQRLADGYRRLLTSLAGRPSARLSELDVLDDDQRHRLLVEWNETASPLPDRCVHELVAEQARRTPDSPAVVQGGTQLSYAELDARANRLAHFLRGRGVGPETIVGVGVQRSVDQVVTVLSVLKAGGAYLPLDPTHPPERLALLIADARARLLLTAGAPAGGPPAPDCPVIDLVEHAPEIAGQPATAPEVATDPENIAYVMYTSGSTGRPKGIGIPHRGIVRLVWNGRYVDLGPGDRVAHMSNVAFDAATFEVWGPLVRGASVVVLPPEVVLSPAALGDALQDSGITSLILTTALFNQVVHERPKAFCGVRDVMFGGEAADARTVAALCADGTPQRLLHVYGPTEATTFATWHQVHEVPTDATTVPIGAPIGNTTAYVLNGNLRPVPVGVVGELYLGGPGLARGYQGAPGQTADRFVPDPFGPPGGRLYRTGDLVRWLAGGALEFVGRADGQVKVRGFRVEVGEIEAALRRHPSVREAVVLARADTSGSRRLVGYVSGDPAPGPDELRRFLAASLPHYMVPAALVVLDELPLNRNGKVDRKALPEPRPEATAAYREARTPLEADLARTWAEILGVERVGLDDDFFEIGGHSLLAMCVIARLRERFGHELSMRSLFEARTVAGLAALLDGSDGSSAAIAPTVREVDLPVSFGQERLGFLDRLEGASPAYTIPMAWHLRGPLDRTALQQAVDALVARHESLRTSFVEVDGVPVQRVAAAAHVPVLFRDATTVTQAGEQVRAEALRPFDLARGPLLRVVVWRLGDDEHVLLLAMHHIVSDGWSMGILVRELGELYAGRQLPELPIQYADYARWQREQLTGDRLENKLGYWRQQLAGLPPLQLPTDRARPVQRSWRGGSVEFRIDPDVVGALERLGRERGATLYMTLLAAFQVLLGRWSGQDDFGVGTPVAGRTRPEVEGLIGFFLNTLVLRAPLAGDPAFDELLDRVRDTALGAYEHQDVPFERVVEDLRPDRELDHNPLYQVLFTLNDWTFDELRLGPVTGAGLAVDRGAAKVDLTLEMVQRDGSLVGSFDYSAELFDDATVRRMGSCFAELLRGIAERPQARLSELELLPAAERERVLVGWNPTARQDPPRSLLERFADQVDRVPDALAVVGGGDRLSYRELDARANRLAHHLRRLGVGPEVRVGLRVARSAAMAVGVLGIWKAGGAFVGFDVDHPPERLRAMLDDADVLCTVDEAMLADAESHCDERPGFVPRPDDLAYIAYTSGSTGRPKGVLVEHRSIAGYLETVLADYRLDRSDVVLQRAAVSFDAFLRDCIGPLTVGATVVVAGSSDLDGVERDLAAGPPPTAILSMVPSLLDHLLDAGRLTAALLPRLRLLILSGEPCTPVLMAKLARALPHLRHVVNQYGPTECTVTTTAEVVDPAAGVERITIGRPIPGTRVHVLDPWQRPVPPGVVGEIYIGGAGVARGYQRRPAETAQRYVPDPFSPGHRLYRTGDAGRYLADGRLEFRGRRDRQVKVRGVRVELGEIEAALAAHPAVRAAAVTPRPNGATGPLLAGYVVLDKAAAPTTADLRRHLETRLPAAMVPAALVPLDALPLLANGKVNRAALPEPDMNRPGDGYRPPGTEVEQAIADVWKELLGVERVGVDDDFFDLGGHSLTALRVISRLRSRLGRELSVRAFFEVPTVSRLAARLEEVR